MQQYTINVPIPKERKGGIQREDESRVKPTQQGTPNPTIP